MRPVYRCWSRTLSPFSAVRWRTSAREITGRFRALRYHHDRSPPKRRLLATGIEYIHFAFVFARPEIGERERQLGSIFEIPRQAEIRVPGHFADSAPVAPGCILHGRKLR